MAVTAGQKVSAALLNALPQPVSSFATGSVSNTTTATIIGQWVIPANDTTTVGRGYQFKIYGTADSNGTGPPTMTMTYLLGNAGTTSDVSIRSTTITERSGSSSNLGWYSEGCIFFTTVGASGQVVSQFWGQQDVTSGTSGTFYGITPGVVASTVDTTSQLYLSWSVAWSAASTANVCRTLAGALYRL